MALFWLGLAVLLVVVAARWMRGGDNPRRIRFPKPGEGMRRQDEIVLAPSEWVSVGTMSREEAIAAKGLLDAEGIPAAVENAGPLRHVPRAYIPPTSVRIKVPEADADRARELLRG